MPHGHSAVGDGLNAAGNVRPSAIVAATVQSNVANVAVAAGASPAPTWVAIKKCRRKWRQFHKKKPRRPGRASHGSLGVMASLLRDIPRVSQPPYWWRSHGQLKAVIQTGQPLMLPYMRSSLDAVMGRSPVRGVAAPTSAHDDFRSGKGIYRNQFVEAFLTKRESASR